MNCPECGKKLIHKQSYDRYDACTNMTYSSLCEYDECECGYMNIPNEAVRGKTMIEARERAWGKWAIEQFRSFDEIDKNFVSKSEAINIIKNYRGKKIHQCSLKEQISMLDWWCIHFVFHKRKYFLKKSLDDFLISCNGLFPLK